MMTVALLREFLGWCTLINLIFLYLWFFLIVFARDWLYGLHRRWFNLSKEQFDVIHYSGMAVFKLGVILLNLTPYIVILLIS